MFTKAIQFSKNAILEECGTLASSSRLQQQRLFTSHTNSENTKQILNLKKRKTIPKMPIISSSNSVHRDHSTSRIPISSETQYSSNATNGSSIIIPQRNYQSAVEGKPVPATLTTPAWFGSGSGPLGQRLQRKEQQREPDFGERLYLTPYIQNGRIKEAQKLAKVGNLNNPVCDGKISEFGYSGYLTVNETHNSNLFFWFFPAKVNPETAPVLLWINGGPGASSMFGLFAGHGPFFVDSIGELQPRKLTWTHNHSVVYIDSPVGTGFSFTDSEDGYCRTLDEVMNDLHKGLRQFFLLFPEYQSRDFYITGQSYTGKYAPALAHKIHHALSSNDELKINLKGFAVGAGLCDPATQTDYGDFLFNIGLIDIDEKTNFDKAYKEVCDLIEQRKWTEAHRILQHLVIGWPRPIVAHFEKLTGYTFNSNYLYQDMPSRYAYYMDFLKNDFVRRGIHVGNQEFGTMKNKVYMYLADDFPQSVKPYVEELLDLNYKVLFYASQFDIIVPHTGIDRFIRSLNWRGSDQYKTKSRKIWLVDNQVGGYVKEVENLTHLLCRNAGHVAPHDQPEACFDMITRFTRTIPF